MSALATLPGFLRAAASITSLTFSRTIAHTARQESVQQAIKAPLQPGTLLRVNAKSSAVNVTSHSGDDNAVIQVVVVEAEAVLEQAHQGVDTLNVSIPDRFIGVELQSRGEPVSVNKVVEANLDIHSHGGDVTLGTIRAYAASINTLASNRCGALVGNEVSASEVNISTGHAPVQLKRLVGQHVLVNLHDRPLKINSMYGERVTVHTGGGDADIGNLDCSVEAGIYTEGGDISVDGLDGNADLSTSGGAIEVHLHSKVGQVRIASGGGPVRVAVSPQAFVEIDIRGKRPSNILCHECEAGTDTRTGELMWHFKPQNSEQEDSARYGRLSEGRVVIDSHGGPVEIVKLGWMDALKQRLSNDQAKE